MVSGSRFETSVPPDEELDDQTPEDEIVDEGDAEIEARARAMGWHPLEEFNGNPGTWRDAREFIAYAEEHAPVARDNNRRMAGRIVALTEEVSGMRRTMDEQRQVLEEVRQFNRTADQRGYDRALAEIEKNKRNAVAAGDTESYEQLVEQQEELIKGRKPADAPPPPPPRPQDNDAARFIEDNPWFKTDQVLNTQMIASHIEVIQSRPDLSKAEQYAEAKRKVMEMYPEKFGGERRPVPAQRPAPRPRAASVATPTAPAPVRAPNQFSINSIADANERAAARSGFDRMKRQLPDMTEAEYMQIYADPHADVLELQRQARSKANAR